MYEHLISHLSAPADGDTRFSACLFFCPAYPAASGARICAGRFDAGQPGNPPPGIRAVMEPAATQSSRYKFFTLFYKIRHEFYTMSRYNKPCYFTAPARTADGIPALGTADKQQSPQGLHSEGAAAGRACLIFPHKYASTAHLTTGRPGSHLLAPERSGSVRSRPFHNCCKQRRTKAIRGFSPPSHDPLPFPPGQPPPAPSIRRQSAKRSPLPRSCFNLCVFRIVLCPGMDALSGAYFNRMRGCSNGFRHVSA